MAKRINWKKLANSIPHVLPKIGNEVFEVVYIDDFKDGKTLGETRFTLKQIVIKSGQSDIELCKTMFHECLHLVSDHCKAGLTENQVLALEKSLPFWLKLGKIVDDSSKKNTRKKK
jgi:hypothetical protein